MIKMLKEVTVWKVDFPRQPNHTYLLNSKGQILAYARWHSDTDIDIGIYTKGLGQVVFKNGAGGISFIVNNGSSNPTNALQVSHGGTGTIPSLQATGTDTNIGINITPKGNGSAKIGRAHV